MKFVLIEINKNIQKKVDYMSKNEDFKLNLKRIEELFYLKNGFYPQKESEEEFLDFEDELSGDDTFKENFTIFEPIIRKRVGKNDFGKSITKKGEISYVTSKNKFPKLDNQMPIAVKKTAKGHKVVCRADIIENFAKVLEDEKETQKLKNGNNVEKKSLPCYLDELIDKKIKEGVIKNRTDFCNKVNITSTALTNINTQQSISRKCAYSIVTVLKLDYNETVETLAMFGYVLRDYKYFDFLITLSTLLEKDKRLNFDELLFIYKLQRNKQLHI